MSAILAILMVVAFAGIVTWTGVPAQAREVVRRTSASRAVVLDRSLTDQQKERHLRAEAPRLIGLLGRIVLGSALALALPLGALWMLDRLGLASLADVLAVLVRLDFILAVSAAGVLGAWWWVGRRGR